VQDVAMQLTVLFCAEMLYSGLQAQDRYSRRSKSSWALQAGTVAHGLRRSSTASRQLGTRRKRRQGREIRAGPPVDVDDEQGEKPLGKTEMPDSIHQLALAEWLGIFAFAVCLVLQVLIRRHDRGEMAGEAGDTGGGAAWLPHEHLEGHAAAPHVAVPVTRTIVRVLLSGGLFI